VTLQAITAKDNYITILDAQSDSVFQVIGYQRQSKSAETINNLPLLNVLYESSNFSKSAGGHTAPRMNDVTLKLEMTVAADCPADLAVLNNPNSTAGQRSAALANIKEAAAKAGEDLEAVWSKVWEITNDARNYNLGFAEPNTIANLWLDQWQRDEPVDQGGFVVVTSTALLMFRIEEPILGDTGNEPATVIYNNDLKVTSATDGTLDPVEQTEVEIQNP
jgi:hypothetical protein